MRMNEVEIRSLAVLVVLMLFGLLWLVGLMP